MNDSLTSYTTWGYISIWILISCCVIIMNKWILTTLHFPFPLFLTTCHMAVSTFFTQLLSKSPTLFPEVSKSCVSWNIIQAKIVPISMLFAFSLMASNQAYIYLSIPFIQMLKAFTPVAVLTVSFITRLDEPNTFQWSLILIICVAVAMTSLGEVNFSYVGFIFQLSGTIAEAWRLVLINIFLRDLSTDPLALLYYMAPICFVLVGAACFVFEGSDLPLDRLCAFQYIAILTISSIAAFALNVSIVVLIAHTSALTLTLSGIGKDVVLLALSVCLFGTTVTVLQYLGYSIALLGILVQKEYKRNPEEMSSRLQLCLAFLKSFFLGNGNRLVKEYPSDEQIGLNIDSSDDSEEGALEQGHLIESTVVHRLSPTLRAAAQTDLR